MAGRAAAESGGHPRLAGRGPASGGGLRCDPCGGPWPRAGLRASLRTSDTVPRVVTHAGEQPHTLSWRSLAADDAGWMFGKSRTRLAPALTKASSWMSDRRLHVADPQARCGQPMLTRHLAFWR